MAGLSTSATGFAVSSIAGCSLRQVQEDCTVQADAFLRPRCQCRTPGCCQSAGASARDATAVAASRSSHSHRSMASRPIAAALAPRPKLGYRNLRRGSRLRAAPPTEEATGVVAEPLTMEVLVESLKKGCRPKEQFRIGTEHEKFGFYLDTLKPLDFATIEKILVQLSERFGWERIEEAGHVIALRQNNQNITLEPGGQFELSGRPVETIEQTCAEVTSHLYQVKAVAESLGVGFLGMGFNPLDKVDEIPIMPKGRYSIMKNYMPKVGTMGLDMMFRTSTVQVNLDFESEEDMIKKFRVGLALQPLAQAIFANSPFTEGKPNGYLSYRGQVWTDVDNNRAGGLPFVFRDDFSFEKYVEYALEVPMYFVYREKRYLDASGMSFKDFMDGKLPLLPGEYPRITDWENHLTTIFPDVRLKKYLEMRGADGGPWQNLCALPALWVGLLYDQQSLDAAADLIADWTERERGLQRMLVPKLGLKTPFRDGTLQDVGKEVVALAKAGLERRGRKEERFIKELEGIVESGITPAERLLELYHTKWNESVEPLYREFQY